jgi:cobalt-zinc-cadmium efflux system protein
VRVRAGEDAHRGRADQPALAGVPARAREHGLPRRREAGDVGHLPARDEPDARALGQAEQVLQPLGDDRLDRSHGGRRDGAERVLVPRRRQPVGGQRRRQRAAGHEAEVARPRRGDEPAVEAAHQLLDDLGARDPVARQRVRQRGAHLRLPVPRPDRPRADPGEVLDGQLGGPPQQLGVDDGHRHTFSRRAMPVACPCRARARHDGPMAHAHGHGHAHGVAPAADRSRLRLTLALIAGFMAVEVVVGILASSLALLSDAAHMLTDAGALALALVASRLAERPARGAMTYGLKRAEILSAQVNGVTLLVLALLIVYEGIRRLADPPDVPGAPVLIVALVGVVVNLAATAILAGANRKSLNVEGAFQHILTDLAAFVATAIAGLVILLTGFTRADGIAALLVAALMLRSAAQLLTASGRVFLEAAPRGTDPQEIGRTMVAVQGVREVHDLHVWEVTSGFPALSAHVLVGARDDCHAVRRDLEALLRERFGIDHTTLQVEHEGEELLRIE